jgi:hypothetical protein
VASETMLDIQDSDPTDRDMESVTNDTSSSTREGDTASIGDLSCLFQQKALGDELLVQSVTKLVKPRSDESAPFHLHETTKKINEMSHSKTNALISKSSEESSVGGLEDTSTVIAGEGDTVSLEDLSEIVLFRKIKDAYGATDNVARASPSFEEQSTKGHVQSNMPALGRTAQTSDDMEFSESIIGRSPPSPTQSEGDTASLGELPSFLLGSNERAASSPWSRGDSLNSTEAAMQSSPSPKSAEPVTKNHQSFGFAQSTKFSSTSGIEETTSPADLADILGLEPYLEKGRSPIFDAGDEHSSDGKPISQRSNVPDESFEIEVRDTASMSGLTDILGSATSSFQERASPISTSLDGLIPAGSENRKERSSSPSTSQQAAGDVSSAEDEQYKLAAEQVAVVSSSKQTRSPQPEFFAAASASITAEARSPMRLTPNSHKKPTPTKLIALPRRVANPESAHSPAKNTRSNKKAAFEFNSAKEVSPQEVRSKRPLADISATDDKENNRMSESLSLNFDVYHKATSSKRRKSSIQERQPGPLKDNSTARMSLSPATKKIQPVGILSSRKKLRSAIKPTQRSVAFGSPEAAEYHIGSPSMSMTPMPASKAKALYAIPRNDSSCEASEMSHDGGEQTVEIEADLNVLVDKITVEQMKNSPSLSPICNAHDDTAPVILPGHYHLSSTAHEFSMALESATNDARKYETTVELEGGIEAMLQNIGTTNDQSPTTTPREQNTIASSAECSPADSSVCLTDARSIASVNSAKSDKFTSELELDAQKLNFSPSRTILNDFDSRDESMDIDEGDTVELEHGMTGLLAAAGVRNSLVELGLMYSHGQKSMPTASPPDDGFQQVRLETENPKVPLPIPVREATSLMSKTSRRSSVASHRFSLEPDDGIQVSLDGMIKMNEYSFISDRSASSQLPNTTEIHTSLSLTQEPVTLTFDEILESAAIEHEALKPSRSLIETDLLVRFNCAVSVANCTALNRWNQFMQAVCREVERRTDNDGTAREAMASVFEEQPERFIGLQREMRSLECEKLNELLQTLLTEGRKAVGTEWDMWLGSVTESFGNSLNEVVGELSKELASLNELSDEYERVQQLIVALNTKKIRKARRKSLVRRKVGVITWLHNRYIACFEYKFSGVASIYFFQSAVSDLEADIRAIENEIAGQAKTLERASDEVETLRQCLNSLEVTRGASVGYNRTYPMAMNSQRDYNSLKGLLPWNPIEISESRISLLSSGLSVHTVTTLTYDVLACNKTSISLSRLPELNIASKGLLRTYTGSVENFLRRNVERLCNAVTADATFSPAIVGQNMHNVGCCLGRLDVVAVELQGLLDRYNGTLVCNTIADSFSLCLEFGGRASKVLVHFKIGPTYPWLPLEVEINSLEGSIDVDIENICKALKKSARVGFGSLARACDIVTAYLS